MWTRAFLPVNVENPNKMGRLLLLSRVRPPVAMSLRAQTLGCQMNRAHSEHMAGELEGVPRFCRPDFDSCARSKYCSIREHAEQNGTDAARYIASWIGMRSVTRVAPDVHALVVTG
jgi:hypothetical protein